MRTKKYRICLFKDGNDESIYRIYYTNWWAPWWPRPVVNEDGKIFETKYTRDVFDNLDFLNFLERKKIRKFIRVVEKEEKNE